MAMTNEEYEMAVCDEGQRSRLTFDIEVRAMIKEAVEMEREACARLCDEWESDEAFVANIADAIRARSNNGL